MSERRAVTDEVLMTDEDLIRRLLARYAHAIDNHDAAGWSELFAPDGRFVTRRGEFVGNEAIRGFMANVLSAAAGRPSKHLCTNVSIEVHGDEASATADALVHERQADQTFAILTSGRYVDRLVRYAGDWRFAR